MNAKTAIEKLSLELVIERSLLAPSLTPCIAALRNAEIDPAAKKLVAELEQCVVDARTPALAERAYGRAFAILEQLSIATSASAEAKPSKAAASVSKLTYDCSHGEEILNSFLAEFSGHLELVEQHLMRLESHPNDHEALNAVFGAMHSLKGITGFLDLAAAHQLAHQAEAVMEDARKREQGIHASECDAILKGVDALREIQSLIQSHARDTQQPLPALPISFEPALSGLTRFTRQSGLGIPADDATADIPAQISRGAERTPGTQIAEGTGLVRVKVNKLDSLIEVIGELVVTQTQIHQDADLVFANNSRLVRNLSQLGKITRELQAVAMSLRMYPLRDVFNRMMRLARDIARKQDKDLEVILEGEDTELDKNVIEALVDPLTHLVRNAVDHGVACPADRKQAGKSVRARLTISARHQSGSVLVSVSDDGRGLDVERIAARGRESGLLGADESPNVARLQSLIFEPGFSTAAQVTEFSGRGVGLDVVRRNVHSLGGRVTVDSEAGQSTTFTLTLPLTLAIIDGLIVRTGSQRYIVPITSVLESVQPLPGHLSTVQNRGEVINIRGAFLPLIRLSEFAGVDPEHHNPADAIVMIVEFNSERYGLVVDELLGQQQVVIRNLGECLNGIRGIASGAILGDGRVGLILDVGQVLQVARENQKINERKLCGTSMAFHDSN